MAEKKEKLPLVVSPKGKAMFPHLSKPDTEGKYADGKYKVTLMLEKAGRPDQPQVDEFISKIEAAHAEARGKKKTDSPVRDGDEKEHESNHGFWLINFKSKFQPDMRDSKKAKLPPSVEVRGGDIVRLAFVMLPYEEGKNAGVSMQLQALMLIEKRSMTGNAGEMFDEEDEGFVVEATDEEPAGDPETDPDY